MFDCVQGGQHHKDGGESEIFTSALNIHIAFLSQLYHKSIQMRRLFYIFIIPFIYACNDDKWQQVGFDIRDKEFTFHTHGSTNFDPCFLENFDKLQGWVEDEFSYYCPAPAGRWELLPIEIRLVDNSFAMGYYMPYIGFSRIGIIQGSRHAAVFAHEYVRALCFASSCCKWDQSSYDWSGFIGDRWQFAETLAYGLCS